MDPKPERENVETHRINLHPSVWQELRRRAFEQETSVSTQIRQAIHAYLTGHSKRRKKHEQERDDS